MKHPLFNSDMEDKFSRLWLKASTSLLWLIFGISALLTFLAITVTSIDIERFGDTLIGKLVIAYVVLGNLSMWFSAQAHSFNHKYYKWVVITFLLWPISFFYLIGVQIGQINTSKKRT